MRSRRTHTRLAARAGVALVVVLSCGAVAPLASAAGSTTSVTAHNGVIGFGGLTSGGGWVEVNPDGSDNGGRHEVVPSGPGLVAKPVIDDVVFSHDGTKVLFVLINDNSLWTANADGTNAQRLSTPGTGVMDVYPAWSADSATAYFTRVTQSPTGTGIATAQLMRVPVAGGNATAALTKPDAAGDATAALSPDGTKLAYSTSDATGAAMVVVVDAKTQAKISTIPGAVLPQYSPDSKTLAVIDATSQAGGLYFYPANGLATPGSKGQLIVGGNTGGFLLGGYAFSPDGTELAYESTGAPGKGELLIQQLSSGNTVHTGVTELVIGGLSWQNGPLYTGPVTPAPTLPPIRPTVARFGGADRIATSVATADAAYGSSQASVAVISRADSYADALAGNALAAEKGGPLMLTDSAGLDPRVAAELTKTLAPHSTVYVLGGTKALSPQVEADIAALGFTPKRLSGSDRFDTAIKIAAEVSPHPHSVLIATGANYPDALAAGAAAAGDPVGGVVVLTDGTSVPDVTKNYLAGVDAAATRVYGVGGQAVTAASTLPNLAGHFTALSGADRYATAAAVANDRTLFPAPFVAGLATGANWPDALSGGAFIGALHGPLLLADPNAGVGAGELDWLHGHGPGLIGLAVFGGPAVVPQNVVTQAGDAAWGAGNWTYRPGAMGAAQAAALFARH